MTAVEKEPPQAVAATKQTLTLHLEPDHQDYLRLFMHALAQTPDNVHLCVTGLPLKPVKTLISAYRLDDRVSEAAEPVQPIEEVRSHEQLLYELSRTASQDVAIRLPPTPLNAPLTLGEIVESITSSESGTSHPQPSGDLQDQRIAIITNIPNHYRVPLFNALGEKLEKAGSSLLVLFLGRTYGRRSWVDLPEATFDHVFLSSFGVRMSRAWHPFIPKNLEKVLKDFSPSTIVSGGFSPMVTGRALRTARKTNASFALWSGETSSGITGSNKLRMIQRRSLLKRVDIGLTYGSRAEEYLLALRPDLPVIHVRNTTPVASDNLHQRQDNGPVQLLAVAEARPGKRLDLVIDAAAECMDLDWQLTIVGDGPSRGSLEERAAKLGDRVTFTGAVPSSKVLDYYRVSEVFLFPSEIDVFGLVVVEALGAGLSTMVSRSPGVVADLCANGKNSIVVSEQSVQAWGGCLRNVIADPNLRSALSVAARRTISRRWTIEHSAEAFVSGLRAAREVQS